MTAIFLAGLSDRFVYSAIAVYALAFVAYAAEVALRTRHARSPTSQDSERARRLGAIGTSLVILAVTLNALGAVARGMAAQRVPWGNMYEFVVAGTTAVGVAYLCFVVRRPVGALGIWVIMLNLVGLGMAVTVLYTPVGVLVPVLGSYWLVVHVAAAIIAGGAFTLGAAASALGLVRQRAEASSERRVRVGAPGQAPAAVPAGPWRYAGTLPPARTLNEIAHTAHVFAFPIWTFAVIAGAIWAENAWGRYWGWDPKETWAFITWVCYAAYLHAESTPAWRGRRAAWLALSGYAAFVFNFFGVNLWITGLHSYAGV